MREEIEEENNDNTPINAAQGRQALNQEVIDEQSDESSS